MSLCSCVALSGAGRRMSGVCEPLYISTRESYYCQCRQCRIQTRVRKFKCEDVDECVELPRSSPCGPSPKQCPIRPAVATVMRRRSLKCQVPKLAWCVQMFVGFLKMRRRVIIHASFPNPASVPQDNSH
ncbi:uncharacterized protein LOC123498555 [Portunus trituberculatus]|uniref:uncharacterized protein LOC123498555 n=1 Tax=Portunus trituberculatus TaxID=210409 RepID=UPI001E1D12B4|nr:uncharacterized protein LOC123498555 [Portunus trituberculatus]